MPAPTPPGPPQRRSAAEQFLKNVRLLIISPPKHGKTLLGATNSAFFKGWPCPSPVTFLEDTLYIGWDPNALEGLVEQGYDAHILDYSTKAGTELIRFLDSQCAKEIQDYVKHFGIKTVIVDTISFLGRNIESHFAKSLTGWDLHGMVANYHSRFIEALVPLEATVLVNAHAKAEFAPTTTEGVANKKATDLPGSGGISAAITGKTKTAYEGLVSGMFPLLARDVPGPKGPVRERILLPYGGYGFEGASRYQRFLGKEEPANLKQMFDKIRAGYLAEVVAKSKAANTNDQPKETK